jgi:hypothetical protein
MGQAIVPREFQEIIRLLAIIAVELERIAEAYEEAHK